MNDPLPPPDATLFIASGCAFCPAVLQGLSDLLKEGAIGRLSVTNITVRPDIAREKGVRSVPWLRIGPFELHGSYTPAQLRQWAERAGTEQGRRDYLAELIENQRRDEATRLVAGDTSLLRLAIRMLGDMETPIGVRIGIGAILEDLAEKDQYAVAEEELKGLLASPLPQVRADGAYYLGLSHNPAVGEWLTPLLQDDSPEVREIAQEALAGR